MQTKVKYKGRKKYSQKDAEQMIESIMQMWATNQECINYWKKMPRTKRDILIEVITDTTRSEMIEQTERQQEYIKSKLDYFYQFTPNYKIKGSFGIAF